MTREVTAPSPAVLSFFEGGGRRRGVDTELKSLLDFPLEYAVRNVFAQGQPMAALTDILAQDSLYRAPANTWSSFPGNHDQPRFLTAANGDISKLMMAEVFVLTTRRVAHPAAGPAPRRPSSTGRARCCASGRSIRRYGAVDLTQLLVSRDQYAFLRTSAEAWCSSC